VEASGGRVLEVPPNELVRFERHEFVLAVVAVAITEGDGILVAPDDALIGERRSVNIAAKVSEQAVGSAGQGLLDVGDPGFEKDGRWDPRSGKGAADPCDEATAKGVCQGSHRDEEVATASSGDGKPGGPVGGETSTGDEEMDVRVPGEGAGPSVEDGECSDLRGAKDFGVSAQGGERGVAAQAG